LDKQESREHLLSARHCGGLWQHACKEDIVPNPRGMNKESCYIFSLHLLRLGKALDWKRHHKRPVGKKCQLLSALLSSSQVFSELDKHHLFHKRVKLKLNMRWNNQVVISKLLWGFRIHPVQFDFKPIFLLLYPVILCAQLMKGKGFIYKGNI
jgi:hypothetical protein